MPDHIINRPNHVEIRPIGIHAYFDKVQVWVRQPYDSEALAELRAQCGRGGIYPENGPARFDARLRQRIELRQPSADALRQLARREDVLINKVEIAIDYVFNSPVVRDEAREFFDRHMIRRWHSKKQQIRAYRSGMEDDDEGRVGTRYDAARGAPNMTALYRNEFSRVTGEVNCVHLEWRLNGLRAVRNAGIK